MLQILLATLTLIALRWVHTEAINVNITASLLLRLKSRNSELLTQTIFAATEVIFLNSYVLR